MPAARNQVVRLAQPHSRLAPAPPPPKKLRIPQDLAEALSTFDANADKIARSFIGGLELKEAPATIYHTNDVGFRGILACYVKRYKTFICSVIAIEN
jgi:hypothetical protein